MKREVTTSLFWSDSSKTLFNEDRALDRWTWQWKPVARPDDAAPVTSREGLALVMRHGGRRLPVGVIGPREASADEYQTAESLGTGLAQLGVQMLCGGRSGVMEAACKGNLEAGGQPIGLLPTEEWDSGNDYVAIPIATGIGPARNAIIARGCVALVAVGGGHGTLSEIAYGLHFDRLVLTLGDAPHADGALACTGVDEAIERVAAHLLFEVAKAVSE